MRSVCVHLYMWIRCNIRHLDNDIHKRVGGSQEVMWHAWAWLYREGMAGNYKKIFYSIIMSLIEIGPVMHGGVDGIIQYLRQKHLLASTCDCSI